MRSNMDYNYDDILGNVIDYNNYAIDNCLICANKYQQFTLNCKHILCIECILSIVSNNDNSYIVCPFCRDSQLFDPKFFDKYFDTLETDKIAEKYINDEIPPNQSDLLVSEEYTSLSNNIDNYTLICENDRKQDDFEKRLEARRIKLF